jgi:hypothetical protein
MPPWHAGSDVLTETIRGIDVERGAAGVLNRVFGLKLVELLKKRLPDVCNSHLASNSNFHMNNPNINTFLYLYYTNFGVVTQISKSAIFG